MALQGRLEVERDRLIVQVNEARVRLTERLSIESLAEMAREWRGREQRVTRVRSMLTRRATGLDALLQEITRRQAIWSVTVHVSTADGAPSGVLDTVRQQNASLSSLAERTTRRRTEILSLLDQISRAATGVESLMAEIAQASDDARSRIFDRERSPIGSARGDTDSGWRGVSTRITAELTQDAAAVSDYFDQDSSSLPWAALVFLGSLPLTYGLRMHVRHQLAAGKDLEGTVLVFDRPIAVALLAACLSASVILSDAPSMAMYLLGLLTLMPVVRLLLPILPSTVQPALLGVGGFFLLDRVRLLVDEAVLVDRLLLLLEAAVGVGLAIALLRSPRWREILASLRYGSLARRTILTALLFLVLGLVANLAGYVAFARLIVEGILQSVVVGIVVYAIDRVATTGLLVVLSTTWARRSGMVRSAAPEIVRYGERAIRFLLAVLAIERVLSAFLLDQVVLSMLSSFLFTPLEVGTLSIALSDLLAFGLTVIASFWLSRFVRFALKEEVFSRIRFQRGIPNAISSTVAYVVLLGGFFIALSAAGIDLSRFSILAGAFGVGIGFGLQNVVNNFVSGLILIYERPVQAGDTVQIGDVLGTINRIGIRSSTIRTFEGAEVIVPNANLIAEEVVNWTLSDKERRIKIPVGVAYGSDHVRVLEVIRAALDEAPHVLAIPAPEVLFQGLGESSLDFEVRVWTAEIFYLRIQSDVLGRIYSALAQAGIEIPFPQRDLHLRSIDGDVARSLCGTPAGSSVAKTEAPES